jgi:transcriptional regulator with XRE-family HTH domain
VTPFGEKLRALRAVRGTLQKDMAAALEISPAYLSALEHGRRGAPSAGLIHQISEYFGLIWDDADELRALAKLSRPRLKLNAAGLTPDQKP